MGPNFQSSLSVVNGPSYVKDVTWIYYIRVFVCCLCVFCFWYEISLFLLEYSWCSKRERYFISKTEDKQTNRQTHRVTYRVAPQLKIKQIWIPSTKIKTCPHFPQLPSGMAAGEAMLKKRLLEMSSVAENNRITRLISIEIPHQLGVACPSSSEVSYQLTN